MMKGRLKKEVELEFVEGPSGGTFKATDAVRAVILRYLTKGDVDEAVTLLSTSAPEVGDVILQEDMRDASMALRTSVAEMFIRARDYARAGRAAVAIGDPARAAPFFERSYEFSKAAELYEQAGKLDHAANLYERNLQFDRAAKLYDESGLYDRAAESHEKGGKFYEAGRLWVKLRRFDRAVESLQKVESSHPQWFAGSFLLARVLEHCGQREQATMRLIEIVKRGPLDATTIGAYERLGEIYVEAGEQKPARKLLGMVLAFDPQRDRARTALAKLGAPPPSSEDTGTFRTTALSLAPPALRGVVTASPQANVQHLSALTLPPPGPASAAGPDAANPRVTIEVAPLVLPPAPKVPSFKKPDSVTPVHPDMDALRRLPALSDLSLDELRSLREIGEKHVFAAGAILIEQDAMVSHLALILDGRVQISRLAEERETHLLELGYGAAIGEVSFFDEGPATARVRALAPTTVFRWPLTRLREQLSANERMGARIARALSRALASRLRETYRLLEKA